MNKILTKITGTLCVGIFLSCSSVEVKYPNVSIVGQMKDVMWKGELEGKIHIDTIVQKEHLYGMGPIEFLSGEIIILDGKTFYSTILSDSSVQVKETHDVKAPFFAYATIPNWKEISLADSVNDIASLEKFLKENYSDSSNPYFFKLKGNFSEVNTHIVNLPKGKTVSSPQEAHEGIQNFKLQNTNATILGFFSRHHQSIFTHHDTYLHLHILTDDHKMLGHIDELFFDFSKIKLFIPEKL